MHIAPHALVLAIALSISVYIIHILFFSHIMSDVGISSATGYESIRTARSSGYLYLVSAPGVSRAMLGALVLSDLITSTFHQDSTDIVV